MGMSVSSSSLVHSSVDPIPAICLFVIFFLCRTSSCAVVASLSSSVTSSFCVHLFVCCSVVTFSSVAVVSSSS